MPAEHDLDPDAMTERERLAKRRYEAYFAFETQPLSEQWTEQSGSPSGGSLCSIHERSSHEEGETHRPNRH